jgi:hypothetical protein
MDEDLSVDWASPPIYDIYPDEEESLEEVNLSDSLAILYEDYVHYMVDKGSKDKYSDFNVEIIDYIDFLGIDNILFNFHNNDGFGVVGNNYMFKREVPADSFLGIFMARGKEKEQEKYGKSKVLPSGVWGRHNNRQGTPLMKSIIIIMGRGLVVKLRREEWNGLTGHSKDRGKDRPNLRTNSLQHGEKQGDIRGFCLQVWVGLSAGFGWQGSRCVGLSGAAAWGQSRWAGLAGQQAAQASGAWQYGFLYSNTPLQTDGGGATISL